MSFSVSRDNGEFEYSGGDLRGLFAQASNIVKPVFWKMLYEIVRFYKEGRNFVENNTLPDCSLGQYLEDHHYSDKFINDHLLPMAAAIWSAPAETLKSYPLSSFLKFCDNHGLIQVAIGLSGKRLKEEAVSMSKRLPNLFLKKSDSIQPLSTSSDPAKK